jgi:hypothetical protein
MLGVARNCDDNLLRDLYSIGCCRLIRLTKRAREVGLCNSRRMLRSILYCPILFMVYYNSVHGGVND